MDGKKLLVVALVGLFLGVGVVGVASALGPASEVEADVATGDDVALSIPEMGIMPLCGPGQTSCGGG